MSAPVSSPNKTHWFKAEWKETRKPAQATSACPGRRRKLELACCVEVLVGGGEDRINGSGPVERNGSEEVKVMRNMLRWMACLPPRAMVMSWPQLLPRPLLGSEALLQLQSVLMFLVPITTKGQEVRTVQSWPSYSSRGCNTRESWPCLSPDAVLRRVSPTPHLTRTVELTLSEGVRGK